MIDVKIQELWSTNKIGIWIIDRNLNSDESEIAKPVELTFEPIGAGYRLPEPTISLPRERMHQLLKALLDALAETRIIDSRAERRDDEVKAIKDHLGDTKKMVDRLFILVEQASGLKKAGLG